MDSLSFSICLVHCWSLHLLDAVCFAGVQAARKETRSGHSSQGSQRPSAWIHHRGFIGNPWELSSLGKLQGGVGRGPMTCPSHCVPPAPPPQQKQWMDT